MATLVGVISDTHGLLRSEVLNVFQDVDLILHAGDIGGPDILKALKSIAPVIAVRGNNDEGAWANRIPQTKTTRIDDISVFLIHDAKELALNRSVNRYEVVVAGHSHRPVAERKQGVLFLNPGSAGPRRFKLPISVARLAIDGRDISAELIELSDAR